MNSQFSIYIPRMSSVHKENSIRQIMSYYSIGLVDYIDFTQINKKPGFCEQVDGDFKSAYVHFLNTEDLNYNLKFWSTMHQHKPYELRISPNEYWICLKNKNPVQRTYMNIHQVVENGRYLENLILEQSNEIKSLREIVEKQQKKIDGIEQVVYQLVGGLFNPNTQSDLIDTHLGIMNIHNYKHNDANNNSKWGIWPTTRQGDSNEERIEKLEKNVAAMTDFNYECFDSDSQDEELCARKPLNYTIERISLINKKLLNKHE